jgi:ABC-2 type transport system ATP-binding protein
MSTSRLDETIQDLIASGTPLENLSIHKPNLEDLFIKLTGSSLRV